MNNTNKKYSLQGNMLIVTPVMSIEAKNKRLGGRGSVKEFSSSSGARMRRYLRSCVVDYTHMVTLTYPEGYTRDGSESKEHLRRFIQQLKRLASKNTSQTTATKDKWSCFWFMEFQQRGAIHYHMFLTCGYPKTIISKLWYEIVGSEDERHLHAGTRIELLKSGRRGTCSYAAKYAAKQEQKTVPDDIYNCGRFWGVSGYRIALSADIVITPEDKGCDAIQRAKDRLGHKVQEAIQEGECTKKVLGTSLIFYIRSDRAVYSIAGLMLRFELSVNLYASRLSVILPHHEDQEIDVPMGDSPDNYPNYFFPNVEKCL